ncbi:hypothetical protein K1719_001092 [Acacia pycnantha]|nr:hypothetical protein K1719_001092 [Acacia pycnantha]
MEEEDDDTSSPCPTFPDCGFKQPNSGVVLSCLDCFLRNGSLYCFEYEVSPSVFMANVSPRHDPAETVIHRAMYLLQNGFSSYDVFQNNCEDFALYCKTGLLIVDKQGVGRSGQASSSELVGRRTFFSPQAVDAKSCRRGHRNSRNVCYEPLRHRHRCQKRRDQGGGGGLSCELGMDKF